VTGINLCRCFFFTVVAFLAVTTPVRAQQQTFRWGIDQCVQYGLENNTVILRSQLRQDAEKMKLMQMQQSYYPTINLSTSPGIQSGKSVNPLTYSFTTTQLLTQRYDLSGTVSLYNFGTLRNSIKAQKYIAKAIESEVDKAKLDLIANIVSSYFQLMYFKEMIKIDMVRLHQSQQISGMTRVHINAGTLPELNGFQQDAQTLSDSITLINDISQCQNASLELKTLLGLTNETELDIIEYSKDDKVVDTIRSAENVYYEVLRKHPLKQANLLRLRAGLATIKSSRSAMLPSISLSYDLNSVFSNYVKRVPVGKWFDDYARQLDGNFNQQVFIKMYVPIFTNGRLKYNYRQAKINFKDAEYQDIQESIKLRQEVYTLYSEVKISYKKMILAEDISVKLKSAYEILLKSYEIGGTNLTDLSIAHSNYSKAELQSATNRLELFFRKKMLDLYLNPHNFF
jgi:outer membrane protein